MPAFGYGYEERRVDIDSAVPSYSRWSRFASRYTLKGTGSVLMPSSTSFGLMFLEPPLMTYGVELISNVVADGMPVVTATVVDWLYDPRSGVDKKRKHVLGARMGFAVYLPQIEDLEVHGRLSVSVMVVFEGIGVKAAKQ